MATPAMRRSTCINHKVTQQVAPAPPSPARIPRQSKSKQQASAEDEAVDAEQPLRKRVRRNDASPPRLSNKSPIETGEGHGIKLGTADKPSVNRLADPGFTNATLLSSGRHPRVVTSRDVDSVAPLSEASSTLFQTTTMTTTTTTSQTLLREACDHLIKTDARLKPLIEKHTCHIFTPEGLARIVDPFENLTSGIISQQVSGAAAVSIKAKFVRLFEDSQTHGAGDVVPVGFPPPSVVAACSVERLRTAGLSQRKAEYIQGLAEKFVSGELNAQLLHDAPYEELMERLVAVRGLGRWSIEMFAMFGLKRMDVFSLGDLGVQRGCAAFVGRDIAKLKTGKGGKWKYMSEKEMVELSNKFVPYRSLFMWYMWRIQPTDVSLME